MKPVNHSDLKFSIVEIEDQILTITINRPEVLNALHRDAHYELSRIFDDICRGPFTARGDPYGSRQPGFLRRQRPEIESESGETL